MMTDRQRNVRSLVKLAAFSFLLSTLLYGWTGEWGFLLMFNIFTLVALAFAALWQWG